MSHPRKRSRGRTEFDCSQRHAPARLGAYGVFSAALLFGARVEWSFAWPGCGEFS